MRSGRRSTRDGAHHSERVPDPVLQLGQEQPGPALARLQSLLGPRPLGDILPDLEEAPNIAIALTKSPGAALDEDPRAILAGPPQQA